MKLIHDSWANKVVGCPMFILQHKLKKLKIELQDWNKNSFGNVHNAVLLKQGILLGIQQTLETASLLDIDGLLSQERIIKEEIDHALHCQYLFWKEKAKMLWFKDEDRNTTFFFMLWSIGEIVLVRFIVYDLIMRLLRILNSFRIIF